MKTYKPASAISRKENIKRNNYQSIYSTDTAGGREDLFDVPLPPPDDGGGSPGVGDALDGALPPDAAGPGNSIFDIPFI